MSQSNIPKSSRDMWLN